MKFEDGKLHRVFTPEWDNSGIVNMDKVPQLVESMVSQRKNMVEYIEELHEFIDVMMEKHDICDFCLDINCGSDHK